MSYEMKNSVYPYIRWNQLLFSYNYVTICFLSPWFKNIYKIIWIVLAFWVVYKCVFIALWSTKMTWATRAGENPRRSRGFSLICSRILPSVFTRLWGHGKHVLILKYSSHKILTIVYESSIVLLSAVSALVWPTSILLWFLFPYIRLYIVNSGHGFHLIPF